MKLPSDAEFLMLVRDKLERDSDITESNGLCRNIERVYYDLITKQKLSNKPSKKFRAYCDHVSLIEHRMLKWVDDMLGTNYYLQYFLCRDISIREEMVRMDNIEYWTKLRATRLAWLDWMIAYCLEKDGK